MVMPRAFSSGALSISSYFLAFAMPLSAQYRVIVAVSVVLPWSTWPIVPTFTCGFLRSNFSLAMEFLLYEAPPRAPAGARRLLEAPPGPLLAGVPALVFLNDLVAHHARNFFVVRESHAVGRAALGH